MEIILIIWGAWLLNNHTPGSDDIFWGIVWLVLGIVIAFSD